MPINVSNKTKSDPVPAGTHHAVCYGIIAVGTQPSEKFTPRQKIVVCFEIPSERITIKDQDLPRGISKRYTLSLNEKSSLRKDLQSWRGKPFTQEELNGFDVSKVIGSNCLISVLHSDRAGAVYADISGISALPRQMASVRPENTPLYFNLLESIDLAKKTGNTDVNWPSELPAWVQKICSQADEYLAFRGGESAESPAAKTIGKLIETQDLAAEGDSENVPF
jgi:hypothetical protein